MGGVRQTDAKGSLARIPQLLQTQKNLAGSRTCGEGTVNAMKGERKRSGDAAACADYQEFASTFDVENATNGLPRRAPASAMRPNLSSGEGGQ
jgi:hypothetical protein